MGEEGREEEGKGEEGREGERRGKERRGGHGTMTTKHHLGRRQVLPSRSEN